jgi:cell wall-associated NlpC family hydrolase
MTALSPAAGRSRAALPAAVSAAAAAVFGFILLLTLAVQPVPLAQSSGSGGLNTSAVPSAYVAWVLKAGSLCAAITPPIIAAQDQVESDWDPNARNAGSGAEGIAQFLPSTFETWGRNDDGTGDVSPYNPRDEIMAQGRYDCYLASFAQQLINAGQASGTATSLALAAYNAGPLTVEQAHGVPAAAASYVSQIESLAATKYTASVPAPTQAGLIAVAAAESALGTPYQYGGSCDDPHGSNPSGWCDCSSLVQMAWRVAGVSLPRTTYQQWRVGTPVASVSQLQPGDLIFIPGSDATSAGPGHVGMYVGNGMLINAPYTGTVVQFASVASWQSQIVAMRHIG